MNKRNEIDELAEFYEGEELKGLLMSEFFAIDGYENEDQERPQKENHETKELEGDPRFEVYREVQHELYVEDAKERVREYTETFAKPRIRKYLIESILVKL